MSTMTLPSLAYDLAGDDPRYNASDRPTVTSPELGAALLAPHFAGLDREACFMLALDTRHGLIERVTVSLGSIDHTFMSPREVYRDALRLNAAAILLAHNHPSGDPTPSRDDERVTKRLAEAGELVGINLLDHLVFGDGAWTSLARAGHTI